jgi:multiple sugar transport system permease protein
VRRLARHLALCCLAALFLAPLLWLLLTALKSPAEQASLNRWPAEPRWDNFRAAVTRIDFAARVRDSLFVAFLYAIPATLSSAVAGYGFARLTARGERPLFVLLIATMMTPSIITVVPTYLLFAKTGLVGTYWPWLLWGLGGSALVVFLFRQFFASIPRELEEAALIDGCGHVRTFCQIFLPQSKPVLAAALVLTFSGAWGDWVAPRLLLDEDRTTLAVAISQGYSDESGHTMESLLAAGSLLYVLPILVLFLVAQRYFVVVPHASRHR